MRGRALRWGSLALIVPMALVVVWIAVASGRGHRPTVAHSVEANRLSVVAETAVSRVLGASERQFFAVRQGRSVTVSADGVAARLSPTGAIVRSRGVAWHLATIGDRSAPTVEANRVTYSAGAQREWFVGGPLGVEQGFTLERPTGHSGALSLAVGRLPGGVRAVISASGRDATLERDGRAVLRYDGLLALDAAGRSLPASLAQAGGRLQIRVALRGARYPVTIDPLVQQGLLTSGDKGGDLGYGALAISDGTIVAGARDYPEGGKDGAVYVFAEPAGGWTNLTSYTARLTDGNTSGNDLGESVAIDGGTIVAGAHGNGYADVFVKPPGGWASTATPTAVLSDSSISGNTGFGDAVAVSGANIAVGDDADSGAHGLIDVFVEPHAGWTAGGSAPHAITTPTAKLTDSTISEGAPIEGELGASVAISGVEVLGGAPTWRPSSSAPQTGAALVFVEPPGGWGSTGTAQSQTAILTPSSVSFNGDPGLGTSVAVDGATAVAGAPAWQAPKSAVTTGAVYLFTEPADGWSNMPQTAVLTASGATAGADLGASVGVSGSTVVAGAPEQGTSSTGAAYLYREPAGGWVNASQSQEMAEATAQAQLGNAVAIEGATVAVSASPGADGSIQVFGDAPLSLTTSSLTGGTQGQAYHATLAASGGTTPYAWSATGLPGGVTLGASTGTIAGTPTAPGTYTPTFTVTDVYGQSAKRQLTLTVAAGTTTTPPKTTALHDLTAPQVTGTLLAQHTVGCDPGTWSEPATFSYQWFALETASPSPSLAKLKSSAKVFGQKGSKQEVTSRFPAPVPPKVPVLLATGPSYAVGFLDEPLYLYCAVTATATGATPVGADAPIEVIEPGPPQLLTPSFLHPRPAKPHIDPGVGVGGTNACTPGDWLGDPKFSYDWYVVSKPGGKKLKHLGEGQKLIVAGAAEDQTVQCLVTAKNPSGSDSAWSNAYEVPQSAPVSTGTPQVTISTQNPRSLAVVGAAGGAGVAQIVDLTCGSGRWNRSDLSYSPEWVVTSTAYPTVPQKGAFLQLDMRPGHLQYSLTLRCIVAATTPHGLSSTAESGPISISNGCEEWYTDVLDKDTVDASIGGPEEWLYATTPDELFDYDESAGNQVNGLFGLAGGDLAINGPLGSTLNPHRAETDGPNCQGYGAYLDGQGYQVKQGPNPEGEVLWVDGGNPFF